ncbi:hypothetical protein NE237_003485 [Protea cynaroides]|uniref:Uncharacterized protein n=1 Tax=Protea cynaroides TaxID=273540 RepID=A0A9Q0KHI0_9MAGN|nr:hypothetical protein NE237_003485 [Protea cynaroides]
MAEGFLDVATQRRLRLITKFFTGASAAQKSAWEILPQGIPEVQLHVEPQIRISNAAIGSTTFVAGGSGTRRYAAAGGGSGGKLVDDLLLLNRQNLLPLQRQCDCFFDYNICCWIDWCLYLCSCLCFFD